MALKRELAPAERLADSGIVTLVGMAGVGKSTVGVLLSRALDWALLDTDTLVEAYFGARLQSVVDSLGREEFLRVEEAMVAKLCVVRSVISTGGSVVYGEKAMAALAENGPIVHLDATAETICARVRNIDCRGLAIGAGQSLASLHAERRPLYLRWADLTVATDEMTPEACVDEIVAWLREGQG